MPFSALGLHAALVKATREIHYVEPTPIQAQAIPPILAGRDLLATAQTGTGKTAAFLLPILQRLMAPAGRNSRQAAEPVGRSSRQAADRIQTALPPGNCPVPTESANVPLPTEKSGKVKVLIVSPTRELAQQIDTVLRGLARHTSVRGGLIMGGTAMGPQGRLLREGVEILIATTGRLLDHLRSNPGCLDQVHTLVLDEADRMLDMGFLPDIKQLIRHLPGRRQTLLFSATMPPVIAQLARDILRQPLTIEIGRHSTPVVGITQAAYPVHEHRKTALLRYLLRHTDMPSVLVFTRTRRSAKRLMKIIDSDGFAVGQLHSDLSQAQRNRAMESFRRGAFQILVATNIAARGLDVLHITHVISHDVPHVPEDYLHRIGRTARAGAEGDAWVLVSPEEERSLADIERQIGQRLPRVTLPDFDYDAEPERALMPRRQEDRVGRSHKGPKQAGRASHPPRQKNGHGSSSAKHFGKPDQERRSRRRR